MPGAFGRFLICKRVAPHCVWPHINRAGNAGCVTPTTHHSAGHATFLFLLSCSNPGPIHIQYSFWISEGMLKLDLL